MIQRWQIFFKGKSKSQIHHSSVSWGPGFYGGTSTVGSSSSIPIARLTFPIFILETSFRYFPNISTGQDWKPGSLLFEKQVPDWQKLGSASVGRLDPNQTSSCVRRSCNQSAWVWFPWFLLRSPTLFYSILNKTYVSSLKDFSWHGYLKRLRMFISYEPLSGVKRWSLIVILIFIFPWLLIVVDWQANHSSLQRFASEINADKVSTGHSTR